MRHAFLALVLAFALPVAACTSVVDGAGVKATGGPAQSGIDPDKLDVGPYPTTPREALGVAGDPRMGVILEGQRMANNVIGPWEVDPTLTAPFGFGALVLASPESMMLIGPTQYAQVVERHNFVNGFASARTVENKKLLMNAVLRFADEASATQAAADLGDGAMNQESLDGQPQKQPIPGHPEALAATYTALDRQVGRFTAVQSFTAHGPYVLMQQAQSTDGADAAAQLVGKSLDLQLPEIDRFRATDPSEFADISIDPTGLLARTIPVDEQQATVTQNTTYERRGALHFQNDPVRSAKLFSDTGTDLVAMGKTNVYETKDADSAAKIVDGFGAELEPTSQPANAVGNMPDSRCLQFEDGAFYCLATADRYAIEVSAPKLLDAQQLTAAQHVMLTSG